MRNWKIYFKKHEKRKPREQLVRAVAFCKNKTSALDLGAGNLVESKFLTQKGFNVVAIDNAPEVKKFAQKIHSKKLKLENVSFQEFDFPVKTFDIVNAQFALPFYGKKNFSTFVKKIVNSLKPNGIFVGQLFGDRDSFKKIRKSDLAFHTKKEVLAILSGFKILEFMEEEKEGTVVSGKKRHWHVFHFIARKK